MTESQERLTVIDASGRTYQYGVDQLPVSLGSGADNDIFVEGTTSVVQIGRFEGAWFVQSARHVTGVAINGVQLPGMQRLGDGDEIEIDEAKLRCRIEGNILRVSVQRRAPASHAGGNAETGQDSISIQPINFRNADQSANSIRHRLTPAKAIVGIAFLVLAVTGWFAFTAKSVRFSFEDQANLVSLPDTFFKFRMGERYLLRSGAHHLRATRDGYYPLDTEVLINSNSSQTIDLAFEKLPGLVSVSTDPPNDVDIILNGRLLGSAPLIDYEMPPGTHEIVFSRDRYFSESREIEIEGGHVRQTFSATLRQNWAPISLSTNPVGAEVLIGGEVVGQTPLELELVEGEHSVEVRLAGYNAWMETLAVTAGERLAIDTVTLEKADGRVRLVSDIDNVAVSLNGDYAGTTPLNLRLRPDRTHTIVATKPGYASATTTLSVAADSGRTVSLDLEALFGDVTILSQPPNATITIDGERVGSTPLTLALSALPHEITVELAGYAPQSRSLTPRANFEHMLEFQLEALNELTGDGYPRQIMTSQDYQLRVLPAGEFIMGSSRREAGRRSNEVLRQVRLTSAFYIGTTEVTNAQFREFRPEHNSGSVGDATLNDDDQPVVNVSWPDVVQYLNWLSIRDGLQPVYEEGPDGWTSSVPLRSGYRLPTEAEWVRAARYAGDAEPLVFPWSANPTDVAPPDRSGNYADIAAANFLPTTLVTYNDDFPVTAKVASFAANASGLYDLGGNVSEWVHDFYSLGLLPTDEIVDDPLGAPSGAYHVIRGSSWRSATLGDLRIAARDYSDGARDDLGFRIARNLD